MAQDVTRIQYDNKIVGTENPIPSSVESITLPAGIVHGQTTVGTTQVQLPAEALNQGVNLKAPSTNTGKLYLGDDGVTTSTGYPLSANEQTFVSCDDLSRIFVISDTSGQKIAHLGS